MTTVEKAILIAVTKGVTHATIIPVIVFILVNSYIRGNFGGLAAALYMIIAGYFYNRILKDKDISKLAFNISAIAMIVLPAGFKILQAMSWGI